MEKFHSQAHRGDVAAGIFFDHRLREGESLELKAAYLRENPVRAGLVARADGWPWVFEAESGIRNVGPGGPDAT